MIDFFCLFVKKKTTTAKKFQYPNDFRKSLENGVLLCEYVIFLFQFFLIQTKQFK